MASGFILAIARRKPGSPSSRAGEGDGSGPDPATEDGGDEGRGMSSGDSRDDLRGEPKDTYTDNIQSCLDDLASVLHVRDADRSKFDSAMEDLAESVAKRCMNEPSDES